MAWWIFSKWNGYVNIRKRCLLSMNIGLFPDRNSTFITGKTVPISQIPCRSSGSVNERSSYLYRLSYPWTEPVHQRHGIHPYFIFGVKEKVCVSIKACVCWLSSVYFLPADILWSWMMALPNGRIWLLLTVLGIIVPGILFFTQDNFPVTRWKKTFGISNRSSCTDDNRIIRQVPWMKSKLTHQLLWPLLLIWFNCNPSMDN